MTTKPADIATEAKRIADLTAMVVALHMISLPKDEPAAHNHLDKATSVAATMVEKRLIELRAHWRDEVLEEVQQADRKLEEVTAAPTA